MTKLMVTFPHFSNASKKNTMAPTGACVSALGQFNHIMAYFPSEQNTMKGQWTRPQVASIRSSLRTCVESRWNVMAHGDAREGKWRGNWRMEWVASTLHTTSEHGVSSITTADAHTSTVSSRLKWPTPLDLNGLIRLAERRNLVSARVPSHFNWPLP